MTSQKRKLKFSGLVSCLLLGLITSQAQAASVVITKVGLSGLPTRKVPPPSESTAINPPPYPGDVYQWSVTADGDILSVNNILINLLGSATLYNHSFGDPGNANKPTPGLEAAFPSIAVDSWIDTPGLGTRLGPDLPGDGTTTIGDTEDNGPQTDFIFAQLTVPEGTIFSFAGRVSIAADGGGSVFDQPFFWTNAPEPPSGALAGAAVLVLGITRRNHLRT
jgi:hypothetical protein